MSDDRLIGAQERRSVLVMEVSELSGDVGEINGDEEECEIVEWSGADRRMDGRGEVKMRSIYIMVVRIRDCRVHGHFAFRNKRVNAQTQSINMRFPGDPPYATLILQ